MSNQKKIVIFAAGTGGHIYPGISIAKKIIQNNVSVVWIGTKKGIENKIVSKEKIPIEHINFSGIRGKGYLEYLKLPFYLLKAIIEAVVVIRKHKPDLALSMGGYIGFPCGLAAYLLRVPIIIHEQNIIFGMSNNVLRHISKKVILGLPMNLCQKKYKYLGNPCRFENSKIKKRINNKKFNILIVGGSLGAKIFNEIVPQAIHSLKKMTDKEIDIIHQTGKTYKIAADQYKSIGIDVDVREYIESIKEAYEWCDIVICRGGAITISEIMNLGKASIIVPYPYATDNHQMKNSKYLQNNNAAIIINQKNFTKDYLASLIISFIDNPKIKEALSENILKLNKKDISKNICMEIMNELGVE